MVDEYYRLESERTPKLCAFLFPSTSVVLENQMNLHVETYAVEQRYIEAVNGIVRPSSNTSGRLTPVNPNHPYFNISGCSSSKSVSPDDSKVIDHLPLEPSLLKGLDSGPLCNGSSSSNSDHACLRLLAADEGATTFTMKNKK
ncbi:hypothetical protein REPUB_Repub03eG0078300 [Reevesia pubescens]